MKLLLHLHQIYKKIFKVIVHIVHYDSIVQYTRLTSEVRILSLLFI